MTERSTAGTAGLLGTFILALAVGHASGQSANPPMKGFNASGSDAEAMSIADETMEAMGGRQAWDDTRFVTWKFFGGRTHVWDKHTGDLRFEGSLSRDDDTSTLALMNLKTKDGRVFKEGTEVTDPAEVEKVLGQVEGAWINDSYWVFMPYKLKDSGVTLKSSGTGTTLDGREADVLELTFAGVGRTPENKYKVYVDKETRLVTQWDFYTKASDPEPRFQLPWLDWKPCGAILLSASRGERGHEDVAVFEELPESVFTDPAAIDIMTYAR